MWQELRAELAPKGLEIVTVALDTGGSEAAGRWIEAASPEHPSLIDAEHLMDKLFGVVNVPSGIPIDENGVIVRPPEPAFPPRSPIAAALRRTGVPEGLDPYLTETLTEARKIRIDRDAYVTGLRDWAANGSNSRFVLPPEEVVRRSHPRTIETATAAAHFELGQHLWQEGHPSDAVAHFREAHRLQPENWTYKRQAWSFAHPLQAPTEHYEGDWLSDVRRIGAENYYPPLDLDF